MKNQYLQIHRISFRIQGSRLQGEKTEVGNLTKETAFQCQRHLGLGHCSLDIFNRKELVFAEYSWSLPSMSEDPSLQKKHLCAEVTRGLSEEWGEENGHLLGSAIVDSHRRAFYSF